MGISGTERPRAASGNRIGLANTSPESPQVSETQRAAQRAEPRSTFQRTVRRERGDDSASAKRGGAKYLRCISRTSR
jgi:hypothetical protein